MCGWKTVLLAIACALPLGLAGCGGGGGGGNGDGGGDDDSDGGNLPTADAGLPAHYFPPGAVWYQDITAAGVDPESAAITQWLEDNGSWGLGHLQIDFSIEVLTADASTPRMAFTPTADFYSPDCDEVPFPVPAGGFLEGEPGYECLGDGDCHLIVVDRAAGQLFEMWRANITGGTFYGGCAAVWDMTRVYPENGRGEQCTSADAAGYPIAALLFSADEVAGGVIDHAIRFILPNARIAGDFYVHPASHAAGSGPPAAVPYGTRWRLKPDFDLGALPSDGARVVAQAMKTYGMFLADGGSVALTGRSDRTTTAKWDGLLDPRDLDTILPTDFEIVAAGDRIPLTFDCVRNP